MCINVPSAKQSSFLAQLPLCLGVDLLLGGFILGRLGKRGIRGKVGIGVTLMAPSVINAIYSSSDMLMICLFNRLKLPMGSVITSFAVLIKFSAFSLHVQGRKGVVAASTNPVNTFHAPLPIPRIPSFHFSLVRSQLINLNCIPFVPQGSMYTNGF